MVAAGAVDVVITDADHRDLEALVRRADELATTRDVEGYLALTTDDMVLDGEQGNASGHSEVRAAITSIWASEHPGTRHLTSDIHVVSADGETARVTSTLSLVQGDGAEETVMAVVPIVQLARKVHEKWLIARRTVGDVK